MLRPSFLHAAALVGSIAGVLVGCGDDAEQSKSSDDDSGGSAPIGGSGGMGGSAPLGGEGGGGGQGGAPPTCTEGQIQPCYAGPAGTEGIGVCTAGSQTCNPDGTWSACTGEVLPQAADECSTPADENCDGVPNETCPCTPNATIACYSADPTTQNVGICHGGTQTCNASGSGWGPCVGEQIPQQENCATGADENCDGSTPPCTGAVIDIRADVNRNGIIDMSVSSEDTSEASWSAAAGAVFLPNLDDDQSACPTSGSDSALAACNDAADNVVNGTTDLLDLARIKSAPWPAAPADASATLSVSAPGASQVRLFKNNGGSWVLFNPATTVISSAELQAGIELGIEGKDILRTPNGWNGYVDITWNVNGGTGFVGGTDTLRMRMAPVIFRHHLHEATRVYASATGSGSSQQFLAALNAARSAAGVAGFTTYDTTDQWNQDYFETAYMSMPKVGGQHVMHINFRSANHENALRQAGRIVYSLRGPDIAAAVQFDLNHNDGMDTLNSFGNFETIPPHPGYPLGRVLRGSIPSFYPDPSFTAMVQAQGVQTPLHIDTAWLLVAHVDETLSFVKSAGTTHGWKMLWNDAALAKAILQQAQSQGHGSVPMFVNKQWSGGAPAQATINQVLADPDVMGESAAAVIAIDDQVADVVAATGITANDMIEVPFLHWETSGYSVAYNPGTVNGIYLSNNHFAAPDPHGPTIGGQDIFIQDFETYVTGPVGITTHWIEDWDLYHRLLGEVHCGTNATRAVPANDTWWSSGQ